MIVNRFKTSFAESIFRNKYAQGPEDSWDNLCERLVNDVCGDRSLCAKPNEAPLMSKDDQKQLVEYIKTMKFIPGGRYLYYAGRPVSFFNNCFALKAEEDTREEWGNIVKRASDCLMSGGGIGVDYSVLRPSGRTLSKTGGISSGPLPLMSSVNEIGRNVMQGGSRRSAIYASLNWQHEDIEHFLYAKDWPNHIKELKAQDFNFPANFDMTNMSINWDTDFINSVGVRSDGRFVPHTQQYIPQLWYDSVKKMCMTGEPGHSYNFWENENETLRNACTEFTSEDDSDVCNLGSINLGNINSIEELRDVVNLASKFLICGSIRGDLPYDKVKQVREKNRKIGLGLMGVHEWLLQRWYKYEMVDELKSWLEIYKTESEAGANEWSDRFFINRPKKYRAVAPAGTIGILASTTTGIEPMFAVAFKRRYLQGGTRWKYQYVIDATAQRIIDTNGISPETIETSSTLASCPEQRIKFQYYVQKYVDMSISSTINLPEWGSELNNEDTSTALADTLLKYCHGLRGITVYPNGSRGGQPLVEVPYEEAKAHTGVIFDEVEDGRCSGGVCGI
jgi:ribonucleoside-diphosphate reductase alpha chain